MKKLFLLLVLFTKISSFSNDVLVFSTNEYIVVANENIAKVYSIKKIELKGFEALDNTFPLFKFDHGAPITSISITPDNKYVITGGGKKAKIWRLMSGNLMARL